MSEHFSEAELRCKGIDCGCGKADMDPAFMRLLERVRVAYGRGMILSSAFRCDDYNFAVGGAKKSAHREGRAVDVVVSAAAAYDLVNVAMYCGMTGIGVSQKGENRFIHLDDMPRKAVWSY